MHDLFDWQARWPFWLRIQLTFFEWQSRWPFWLIMAVQMKAFWRTGQVTFWLRIQLTFLIDSLDYTFLTDSLDYLCDRQSSTSWPFWMTAVKMTFLTDSLNHIFLNWKVLNGQIVNFVNNNIYVLMRLGPQINSLLIFNNLAKVLHDLK